MFELAAGSNTITALASFNFNNGANPTGGVALDSAGNLYGTTQYGGSGYSGTVFEVAAGSNTITTLASFNYENGANPAGAVVLDSTGNLYGTTQYGGNGDYGTVFELAAGSHIITTLASFNYDNGANPTGGVVLDSVGNLYGTGGIVFEVTRPAPTTMSMNAPTITYGAAGVVTLTVAATNGAPTPTGTVQLNVDGMTTYTATLVNGKATFTIPSPNAGPHALRAAFGSQDGYAVSYSDGSLTVNKAASSVAVTGGSFVYDGTSHFGGSAVVSGAGVIDPNAAVLSYTGDQVSPGTYTVTATFAGDANHTGSSASATITIALPSTPGVSKLSTGELLVIGTSGNDSILVNKGAGWANGWNWGWGHGWSYGLFQSQLGVSFNGVTTWYSGVADLVVYGLGGNDLIQISDLVNAPATLFGGAGNDMIKSGGGTSVIVGGDGNDVLLGGVGRSVLIGGNGADVIGGSVADDVLISGTTAYDSNLLALTKIGNEWGSSATFANRVNHLNGTLAGGLNGDAILTTNSSGRTVFDDNATDVLVGNGGNDWFIFNSVGGVDVDWALDMNAFEGKFDLDL